MQKILAASLAAALVMGLAGIALAGDAQPPTSEAEAWHHGRDKAGPPMFGLALGLDQAQLDAMKALRQEHRAKLGDVREQLDGLRTEYRTALDSNDREQIAELRDQFSGLHQELATLRDEYRDKWLAVLTPEQRQLLEQYKSTDSPGQPGHWWRGSDRDSSRDETR